MIFRHDHEGDCRIDIQKQAQRLNALKNTNTPKWSQSIESLCQQFNRIDIMQSHGKTLDEKDNLYFETVLEDDFAFSIFVSKAAIRMVERYIPQEQRFYVLDATFRIVPKPFYQLLIISIEYKFDVCIFWFQLNTSFQCCY